MAFLNFLGKIGSALSPFGAPLSLAGGALAGGLSSAISKSPKMRQVSRLTPQQLGWQNELGNMAMQGLRNPYEGFEPIENQARQQFQTSTIPSLAERFTAMGSGGQRSSAFQGALGQAGAGLEQSLAALRSQYGLQNRQLSGNQLAQALQPNFETYQQQKAPGFLESTLGSLAGPLGQYGSMDLLGLLGNRNQAPGSFGGSQDIMPVLQQILQLLRSQGVQ